MTNVQIFKVKVNNVPKELKVIELNPKKSYYFQEFDKKLKLIQELCKEKKQSYKMDITLHDPDGIEHYLMPEYRLDSNMPTSIMKMVKRHAMKQTDLEEKGVTKKNVDDFMELLEESDKHDVAENKEFKTGKLKKAGLFSRLKFGKKKETVEELLLDEEEIEEMKEKSADELAGNTQAEHIYETNDIAQVQVVDLPDSQESNEIEESSDNITENSENITDETHLDGSVEHSENQINDDNVVEDESIEDSDKDDVIEKIVIKNEKAVYQSPVSQSKVEGLEKINLLQEAEKQLNDNFDVESLADTKDERREYKSKPVEEKDPLEARIKEYLNSRDKEKNDMRNAALSMIENELHSLVATFNDEIHEEVLNYLENNKPDYQSHINQLIDQESPLNGEQLNKLSKQIDEEIELILEKDDKEYELARNLKKTQLNHDKESRMDEKRKEINQGIEILKERTKAELDEQLNVHAEEYKQQLIERKKNEAIQIKRAKLDDLIWQGSEFDRETYARLQEIKRVYEEQELKKEQQRLMQRQQENDEKMIALQQREQELDRKQMEIEKARLEAIKNEEQKSKNELLAEQARQKINELELEKAKQEVELRTIEAKEEENRINKERNRLKELEIENKEKETDSLNQLAKNKMYQGLIGSEEKKNNPSADTKNVVQTVHPVQEEEKFFNKPGFIGAIVASVLLLSGYMTYEEYNDNHDVKQEIKSDDKVQASNKTDEYKMLVDQQEYMKAYELQPSKAKELKELALSKKDYIEAVKLAKATGDNEYLMNIYLTNKNYVDLTKAYNYMTYEEQAELKNETHKKIAEIFIDRKQLKDAMIVNNHLNNPEITAEIDELQQEIINETDINATQ